MNEIRINIKHFIGTFAEIRDIDLTKNDVGVGSTYWTTDTKTGYIYDGTVWVEI